jgi:hypothetical protein
VVLTGDAVVLHTTDLIVYVHNVSLLGTTGRNNLATNHSLEARTSHTKSQLRHVDERKRNLCTVMDSNDHPLPT